MQMDDRLMAGELHGSSSISPAQSLSSDKNDSPQVIVWTAGRTLNRRHILVCLHPHGHIAITVLA